ncbi:probable polygalacturonase At2g43860 [Argentina anserina]|uniref:probable polygalacturonase At2g43860 n=1 Tax=Argentina anserina TaxID=57926 RepID=UPI0021766550|nr:probable polygalacturonase At2g43860 [Potentilla anserina]
MRMPPSVGSLGTHPDDKVEEVNVRNIVVYKSQNGARIKTFGGRSNGHIRAISFNNIILVQTRNPIIIDQHYYSDRHGSNGEIKVSDITFSGFRGTAASNEAIILKCSNLRCTNIVMDHVNISSMIPGMRTSSYCEFADGRSSFTTPDVPCLHKH